MNWLWSPWIRNIILISLIFISLFIIIIIIIIIIITIIISYHYYFSFLTCQICVHRGNGDLIDSTYL